LQNWGVSLGESTNSKTGAREKKREFVATKWIGGGPLQEYEYPGARKKGRKEIIYPIRLRVGKKEGENAKVVQFALTRHRFVQAPSEDDERGRGWLALGERKSPRERVCQKKHKNGERTVGEIHPCRENIHGNKWEKEVKKKGNKLHHGGGN